MSETETSEQALFPPRVGEQLRAGRERAGLDIGDVATRTRIPLRHLEAIERDDYGALPAPTYAIGFARSYARAIGIPDAPLVETLRHELGRGSATDTASQGYEPADPARIPPRWLAWGGVLMALLVLGGFAVWRSYFFNAASTDIPAVTVPDAATPTAGANGADPNLTGAAAPSVGGQVLLTANSSVWVRISDGSTRLLMKEMAAGETFSVPRDAKNPVIITGRPNGLKVTIDGREVAPLGPPERTIKDVPISAAALASRPPAPIATTPVAAPGMSQQSAATAPAGTH